MQKTYIPCAPAMSVSLISVWMLGGHFLNLGSFWSLARMYMSISPLIPEPCTETCDNSNSSKASSISRSLRLVHRSCNLTSFQPLISTKNFMRLSLSVHSSRASRTMNVFTLSCKIPWRVKTSSLRVGCCKPTWQRVKSSSREIGNVSVRYDNWVIRERMRLFDVRFFPSLKSK